MPVYDCLWNDARGRNQDPITFVSSSLTPDCSWLWTPALGTQFLRQEHTVFPSPLPENKSHRSNSSKKKKTKKPHTSKGFPDSSVGKQSSCNAADSGSIPGMGRSAEEWIGYPLQYSWASLVAQLVKNLPAMQETWVRSLGWEDPLEKGKAIHSSILAWRIPWTV